MVANLAHLAKAHYSPGKRRFFTAILGLLLATPTLMAAPKVPVIKVHAADATRHFQPRKARVNAMLQAGLQALAPDFHWRQLISTNDIVGLKVNARLGTLTGTRPAVVRAVAQSLMASGVPAKNIVIWDRNLTDLQRAGYTPLARELGVQLAGSREVGFGEWDAYTVPALHWELAVGDHLFGKTKTSTKSHVSRLITNRLTAIISIHPPIADRQNGARGHLQELAMAAADNTDRFRISTPHLTPAIPELLDRIAFSHALPGPVFRKKLQQLQTQKPNRAFPLHLLETSGEIFYYFEEAAERALPPHTAFTLAYETAKETGRSQTLLIRGDTHEWEQIIHPDGRNTLQRRTLGKEEARQTKLRLHITDALLCQFHQGDQSRPDYATAINELWISRDPVALDALSAELIASLRRSLNLPVRRAPDAILRYASKMYLGSDRREDWDLRTIKLGDRAPE